MRKELITILKIDTSKLIIGDSIKNYKELCKLVNQEVQAGNTKKAQLTEWERYFNWEKIGVKFLITDTYEKPLSITKGRKVGNNSIYVKYIEAVLLRYMSKQKDYTCILTKKQLWLILGMINNDYQRISYTQLKDKDMRITPFEINHFYMRCNQRLEKILFTSLRNLQNRCLITFRRQLRIIDINGNSFIADSKQIKQIDAVKKEVLNANGFENLTQVIYRFKTKEFFEDVNEILSERYGWQFSYNCIELIYTPENIAIATEKQDIELEKVALNKQIIKAIDMQAESNVIKQENKFQEQLEKHGLNGLEDELGIKPKEVGIFNYPKYYVQIQQMLSSELLSIDNVTIDISEESGVFTDEEDELFAS